MKTMKIKKPNIEWLESHRCEHRHTYLEHYNCFLKKGGKERIGFLDIEATNLDANWGIMLSYCIKDSESKKIYEDVITKKDINSKNEDKRIVENCIEDMMRFDRIVTWYGARFDIPYIRTRALILDIIFPQFGSQFHKDAWFISRAKLKLNSNRLETVARSILGKTQKTHLDPKYWRWAIRGDKKSLDYILDHNRKDVLDLEKIWNKIYGFQKINNTSI